MFFHVQTPSRVLLVSVSEGFSESKVSMLLSQPAFPGSLPRILLPPSWVPNKPENLVPALTPHSLHLCSPHSLHLECFSPPSVIFASGNLIHSSRFRINTSSSVKFPLIYMNLYILGHLLLCEILRFFSVIVFSPPLRRIHLSLNGVCISFNVRFPHIAL